MTIVVGMYIPIICDSTGAASIHIYSYYHTHRAEQTMSKMAFMIGVDCVHVSVQFVFEKARRKKKHTVREIHI